MALDVDRLRAGLEDYRRTLATQGERLRVSHGEIQNRFDALWSVYAGQMAEDFQARWSRTAEWLQEYQHTVERLDRFLAGRIDELKHL